MLKTVSKVFNDDEKEEPVKIKKEESVKIIKQGTLTTDESSLFYSNKYSFIEFKNVGRYMDDFLVPRSNNYLIPFKQRLKEFKKRFPKKAKTKQKKKDRAS